MVQKQTITKAEIAEHFVSVEQLQEDLTTLVHEHYAHPHAQRVAV